MMSHEGMVSNDVQAKNAMILPSRPTGTPGKASIRAILAAKRWVAPAPQDKSTPVNRPSRMKRLMAVFGKDRDHCTSESVAATTTVNDICETPGEAIVSKNVKWSVWKFAQNFRAFRRISGYKGAAASKASTMTKMARSFRNKMREAACRRAIQQQDDGEEVEILGAPQTMPYFMLRAPVNSAGAGEVPEVAAAEGYSVAGNPARALLRQRLYKVKQRTH